MIRFHALPHKKKALKTTANKIRRVLRSNGRGAAELYAAHCGMADYLKNLPAYKNERVGKKG